MSEALNPFDLLGVTIASTEAEARASFRELALLAHPDKGGQAAEMRVLMHAYRYVVEQLGAVNRTRTVEDLERGFATFCADQREDDDVRPPWLTELLNLSGGGREFDELFHRRWLEAHEAVEDVEAVEEGGDHDLLSGAQTQSSIAGYGSMMAPSEYAAPEGVAVAPVSYRENWEAASTPATTSTTSEAPRYAEFRRAVVLHSAPMATSSMKPESTLVLSDYASAFNATPEELLPNAAYTAEAPVDQLLEARLAERLDAEYVLPLPDFLRPTGPEIQWG